MRALRITVLYDGAEDEEKRKVEAEGGKLPLVSEAVAEKLSERGHEVRRLAAAESALELARQIADDDSRTNASPAVHGGQVLLRTDKRLYCIGSEK